MSKFIFLLAAFLMVTVEWSRTQTLTLPDSAAIYRGDTTFSDAREEAHIQVLEIDGSGSFTEKGVNVNDTLSYIITVEWKNPKIPIMVMAPESLTFAGFQKTKAYTSHKKIARVVAGESVIKNKSQFIYNLKAEIPGSGKASSTRLPYYSALRQEQEYVTIGPQLINIGTAITPLNEKWYVKILFWILIAAAAGAAGHYLWKKRRAGLPEQPVDDKSLTDKLKDLKTRIDVAETKEFILELESLAIVYLREAVKNTGGNFSTLLEDYLERFDGKNRESWGRLKNDFDMAKFGGGNKQPHELRESYKLLTQCINQKEEQND